MPTQNDIFQAQMVQQLAQNLRQGFAQDQRQEDIAGQQAFRTSERQGAQQFSAGQQTLRLESAERQATTRASRAQTEVNIQLAEQKKNKTRKGMADSLTELDFVKVTPSGDPNVPPKVEISEEGIGSEGFGTSTGQARHMKKHFSKIKDLSEEDFQNIVEDINTGMQDLITKLGDKNVFSTPSLDTLMVQEGETKDEYLKRIKGFRKSLIDREIAASIQRLPESRKDRVPRPTKQVVDKVTKQVIDKFGGALE